MAATRTFERFLDGIRRIRYRDGRIAGYASRLHYSVSGSMTTRAWGSFTNVTRDVGGVATGIEGQDGIMVARPLDP